MDLVLSGLCLKDGNGRFYDDFGGSLVTRRISAYSALAS